MLPPFSPEPYVDFNQDEPRNKMVAALDQVRAELGKNYPLWINGEAISASATFSSVSPANPDLVIGVMAKADADLADRAVRSAAEAFKTWSRVDPDARARILIKGAAIMRRRVYELSAWMCFEESKTWIEAYADACEAIDFLDFYGREMMRLGGAHPVTPFGGEENEVRYMPLGVGVVIPPWNFPLAIAAGMTTAALVTGNTVVLKPASTSPVVAASTCRASSRLVAGSFCWRSRRTARSATSEVGRGCELTRRPRPRRRRRPPRVRRRTRLRRFETPRRWETETSRLPATHQGAGLRRQKSARR